MDQVEKNLSRNDVTTQQVSHLPIDTGGWLLGDWLVLQVELLIGWGIPQTLASIALRDAQPNQVSGKQLPGRL